MKKFGSLTVHTCALISFIVCANSARSQQANSQSASSATSWLEISDCLLEIEQTVTVPVQEAGILQSLEVKLNEAVGGGKLLARLDNRKLTSEFENLKKESVFAHEKAQRRDSAIKYAEKVSHTAAKYLKNYEEISNSVNESEITQRKLAKDNAEESLQRAKDDKISAEREAARIDEAMKAAELRLQNASIKSPLTGIVSEIFYHPGEWVQVGQPLLTISDMEHLVVHAHVPIDQIDRSQLVGSAVQVESTTDHGDPIRVNGTVSSYDPHVASRGLIRIHAQVLNVQIAGHWQILPGKQVTLHLAVPANKSQDLTGPGSQTAAR